MNRIRGIFSVYLMIGFAVFGLVSPEAYGQGNRNEREIRDITRQLNNQVDNFQNVLSNQLRRNSSIDRQDREKLEDDVLNVKDDLRRFETEFNRRRETAQDVTKILESAKTVNDFIKYNSINARTDRDWEEITSLLDRLASNYNVNWNWDGGTPQYTNDDDYSDNNNDDYSDNNNYPSTSGNSYNASLTGTYQLDNSRSENPQEIAERAIRNSGSGNNQANREDLEDKLQSPEQIAIDVRGNQITLGTSLAQPVTFTADGRDQTQTTDDGRTIRVRTTLRGQELTVSSLGGETDFTITFISTENGKSMKVSRRITTDYLRQTVFAESVYNKTDQVARLNGYDFPDNNSNSGDYSSNDPGDSRTNPNNYPNGNNTGQRRGTFIVPDGTIITGTLDNDIDTKVSQNNDRFKMTVSAPNQFRGAVIDGYLSGIDRSGKISGRSEVTFNFQTIRLRNGQSYDFAGNLQSVTDENGKTVKIDGEGAAKGDSQTKETIKRGGIGAGIGAIIGAIAGGGKGAAIGAIIGGGAGAGSVVLQGKDDLQLKTGSQITVQASSPLR